jgi:uncharacterized protein (TIGR03118 family)
MLSTTKINHFYSVSRLSGMAVLLLILMSLGLPALAQTYTVTRLVSDIPNITGNNPADPDLGNPWGLVASSSGPWWVSDNNTGLSTLYNGSGVKQSLVVTIPSWTGSGTGAPSGIAFNGTSSFQLSSGNPAFFLFDSEDGTVQGWNPSVNPNTSVIEVNNFGSAVYKGLALASANGANYLYATNFFAGTVDVFDTNFAPHSFGTNAFVDSTIPSSFAPFGIQLVGSNLVVTYAKQDSAKHDDVPGPGNGYVDVWDTQGNLIGRLPHIVQMDSPWGIAQAPSNFGGFSNDLLIGNFGSGSVMVFNSNPPYNFISMMLDESKLQLRIDKLWALVFGNGGSAGPTNTLFFTAGTFDETYGILGTILPTAGQGIAAELQRSSKIAK